MLAAAAMVVKVMAAVLIVVDHQVPIDIVASRTTTIFDNGIVMWGLGYFCATVNYVSLVSIKRKVSVCGCEDPWVD